MTQETKEQKQVAIKKAIEEYLSLPDNERSLTKIGIKYGVRRQTLSEHLKKMNIEVVNYQNRKRINETVFDVIDTEAKAYWLGFLYADGNISSTGNKLEINLSAADWEHLKAFQDFLEYTENSIRIVEAKGSTCGLCRFSVRNKHIWNALNTLGCTPKKSLTLVFPNIEIFAKKSLVYDFIRGYVDGDGSLGIYPDSDGCLKSQLSIVGTYEFLSEVINILGEYTKVCSTHSKAYDIHYGYAKARKVARLLYQNATIYLPRKYEIYQRFCQLEEESSMRKSSKIGEGCDANTEISSEIAHGSETL